MDKQRKMILSDANRVDSFGTIGGAENEPRAMRKKSQSSL